MSPRDELSEKEENHKQGVVYKSADTEGRTELLKSDPHNDNGPLLGKRHIQIFTYFLLVFIAFGARINLSIGIVAMTDPTASPNPDVPTYNWTDKSIVLSSFFWGYIVTQTGAGWLANTYGPKWFLVGIMSISSLLVALLPATAAIFGSKGVMTNRAIQGLAQGFVFPSTHNLLAHWVPPSERSRLGTFAYAAGPLGTVVSMLVTGLISSSWYGWPFAFYLYGGLGLLWSVMFAFIGYNAPAHHPSITKEEKFYIEHSLGHAEGKGKIATPWKKILTSKPVWAIFLTQSGNNWGFWTLLTQIPAYMNHVMNFNMKSNSMLSALPFFALWVLSFFFSVTADSLINRKILSIGASRKLFNTIGLVGPAIALFCLGNTGPDETSKAVTLLVLGVGINSGIFCGFIVNHIDISPNFSGTIMGITNGASHTFAIVAPLVVQYIVTNEKDPSQWKVIFYISGAIYVLASVVFIILGSGEIQSWNHEEKNKEKEKTEA